MNREFPRPRIRTECAALAQSLEQYVVRDDLGRYRTPH